MQLKKFYVKRKSFKKVYNFWLKKGPYSLRVSSQRYSLTFFIISNSNFDKSLKCKLILLLIFLMNLQRVLHLYRWKKLKKLEKVIYYTMMMLYNDNLLCMLPYLSNLLSHPKRTPLHSYILFVLNVNVNFVHIILFTKSF